MGLLENLSLSLGSFGNIGCKPCWRFSGRPRTLSMVGLRFRTICCVALQHSRSCGVIQGLRERGRGSGVVASSLECPVLGCCWSSAFLLTPGTSLQDLPVFSQELVKNQLPHGLRSIWENAPKQPQGGTSCDLLCAAKCSKASCALDFRYPSQHKGKRKSPSRLSLVALTFCPSLRRTVRIGGVLVKHTSGQSLHFVILIA